MSKEEEKTALERKLQIAVDGHSADVIEEALLLVLHRILGTFKFGRLLLGSNYR
jgi:hypothetical protein